MRHIYRFTDYQTLHENDFSSGVFDDVKVVEGKIDENEVFHYKMDKVWNHINKMKIF